MRHHAGLQMLLSARGECVQACNHERAAHVQPSNSSLQDSGPPFSSMKWRRISRILNAAKKWVLRKSCGRSQGSDWRATRMTERFGSNPSIAGFAIMRGWRPRRRRSVFRTHTGLRASALRKRSRVSSATRTRRSSRSAGAQKDGPRRLWPCVLGAGTTGARGTSATCRAGRTASSWSSRSGASTARAAKP